MTATEQELAGIEDYVSPVYTTVNNENVVILPRIMLAVKDKSVLSSILTKFQEKLSIEVSDERRNYLKCHVRSADEVLALIAQIEKTEGVLWCEPDKYSNRELLNPLYKKQWSLSNTGQNGGRSGIDINVEKAWQITNGSSKVKVAVIDQGVDRNHEDLVGRVLDEGYTVAGLSYKGEPYNWDVYNNKSHGIACAGIIAANNNDIGLRGIASNTMILPVNIAPFYGKYSFASDSEIAQAIRYAYKKADILSCSWGGGSPSNEIRQAITEARTIGREGKGCVVIFSSGNKHQTDKDVAFPSSVNGVITVGAVDKNGVILDYSQRGNAMDLVAPSEEIVTTDRMGSLGYTDGNYMFNFNGTSASCPQVAGVAALMLAVNPSLTEEEVRTTLQRTAKDLGSRGFDTTYGYGLVDAYAAVSAVMPQIEGDIIITNQTAWYTIPNLPSHYRVEWNGTRNGKPVTVTLTSDPHGCVLPRSSNDSFEYILQAKVYDEDRHIMTLTKNIYGKGSVFEGIYRQEECFNTSLTYTKKLLKDNEGANFIIGNWPVYLISPYFKGLKFVADGGLVPTSLIQDGGETVRFTSPNIGSAPLILSGRNEKGKEIVRLIFFVRNSMYSIQVNQSSTRLQLQAIDNIPTSMPSEVSNAFNITTRSTAFDASTHHWQIEAYHTQTGHKVFADTFFGKTCFIDTSSWERGVYVLNILLNEEQLSHKIVVE